MTSALSPRFDSLTPPAPTGVHRLLQLKDKICDVDPRWGILTAASIGIGLSNHPYLGAAISLAGATGLYLRPHKPSTLVMFTANVLGIFSDPFEFRGKYGLFIDSVKQRVENLVIGKSAGKNPSAEAIQADLGRGPVLKELLPIDLWESIKKIARENGLPVSDFDNMEKFLEKYQGAKLFHFLGNSPPSALLGLDKSLRDAAKNAGENFNYPILNSPAPIPGSNLGESKLALAHALFTPETFKEAKVQVEKLKTELQKNSKTYQCDQGPVDINDIQSAFASPLGTVVFFYLYQINILQCLDEEPGLISDVNEAKRQFMLTLGDPVARANLFADKFKKAKADVVFTQECDSALPIAMSERGFVSTEKFVDEHGKLVTASSDGSVIFLNPKAFTEFRRVEYNDELDPKQKVTILIAKQTANKKDIVLSSCHGSASNAKEALDQISKVKRVFDCRQPGSSLAMGIDANPKNEIEMANLREHIAQIGLQATSVGTTSNKTRTITPMKEKVYDPSTMEKDLVITDRGFRMENETVGFEYPPMDLSIMLPNAKIPSDHAPVGVRLIRVTK